ncbi:uncharacterized protein BJX67DRAFT_165345 [Aspergillus lucknowensis]|uniref:Mpv17/PMP22 family protein n=1 Tax=Aspergillus lucknowensis TaxID=176173 RepID=A0ABR4M4N1_9EURO
MAPSLLTTTIIQSTVLNAVSNILAQLIDQYKRDKPFALNTPALLQFVTYGIIIVPINLAWQRWLEVTYPGFLFSSSSSTSTSTLPISSAPAASSITQPRPGSGPGPQPGETETELIELKEKLVRPPSNRWLPRWSSSSSSSGKRKRLFNFTMKFLLDQTAGGILNITMFVVLINLLKGASLGRACELVLEDFTPIMIARMKFRPIVSTLLYTVVPLDRRVVFGSACGVIWGVYLSLYAAV